VDAGLLLLLLLLLLLQGRVNYVDWSPGGWHPKTFAAKDITPALVPRMRGGGATAAMPAAALPGHLTAARVVDADTAAAAAVAKAVGETLAKAEAQVAAARAAAATAAAALRLQEAAAVDEDDDGLEPPCGVAAAMYSASSIFQQPPAGDGSSAVGRAAAAAAAVQSLGSVVSDVQYHLRVQMSWLRKKGRQLDSEHGSSSSSDAGDGYDLWRDGAAKWIVDAGYVPLASHCPLFARKFTAGVVNETLAMALSCAGLGLGSWCADQQWLSQAG
jgi:hypothetical protein